MLALCSRIAGPVLTLCSRMLALCSRMLTLCYMLTLCSYILAMCSYMLALCSKMLDLCCYMLALCCYMVTLFSYPLARRWLKGGLHSCMLTRLMVRMLADNGLVAATPTLQNILKSPPSSG